MWHSGTNPYREFSPLKLSFKQIRWTFLPCPAALPIWCSLAATSWINWSSHVFQRNGRRFPMMKSTKQLQRRNRQDLNKLESNGKILFKNENWQRLSKTLEFGKEAAWSHLSFSKCVLPRLWNSTNSTRQSLTHRCALCFGFCRRGLLVHLRISSHISPLKNKTSTLNSDFFAATRGNGNGLHKEPQPSKKCWVFSPTSTIIIRYYWFEWSTKKIPNVDRFKWQIWVCFRKWWYPQIIHLNRVFHYFHHPFWGDFPLFLVQTSKNCAVPCHRHVSSNVGCSSKQLNGSRNRSPRHFCHQTLTHKAHDTMHLAGSFFGRVWGGGGNGTFLVLESLVKVKDKSLWFQTKNTEVEKDDLNVQNQGGGGHHHD